METTHKSSSANKAVQHDSLLEEFFVDELKDIYWAEKALIDALATLEKAAHSPTLKDAFTKHSQQTTTQISRLEQIFTILGLKAVAVKCEAMKGIIEEGETIIDETESGTATRDVGLIMAAQKAEHYEIATYGGLAQLAKTLGKKDIADLLEITLNEEKETDRLLSEIAEKSIHYQAIQEQEKK